MRSRFILVGSLLLFFGFAGGAYAGWPITGNYTCGSSWQKNYPGGMVFPANWCDDGNARSGDGCSSDCTVEPGAACETQRQKKSVCVVCGNGKMEKNILRTETCDDGNSRDGDGCSAGDCQVEGGWVCAGKTGKSVCSNCGNGKVEGAEKCDDGFRNGPNSYCSDECKLNTGWKCTGNGTTLSCKSCGNGIVENGEKCDDGSNESGDGCSNRCIVEKGYSCQGSPSVCTLKCGNGVHDTGEECDLGSDWGTSRNESGAGCNASCKIEKGWTCSAWPANMYSPAMTCTRSQSSSSGTATAKCGDGKLQGGEQCDAGSLNGQGCMKNCKPQAGWTCTNPNGNNQPSVCDNCRHYPDGTIICM